MNCTEFCIFWQKIGTLCRLCVTGILWSMASLMRSKSMSHLISSYKPSYFSLPQTVSALPTRGSEWPDLQQQNSNWKQCVTCKRTESSDLTDSSYDPQQSCHLPSQMVLLQERVNQQCKVQLELHSHSLAQQIWNLSLVCVIVCLRSFWAYPFCSFQTGEPCWFSYYPFLSGFWSFFNSCSFVSFI